MNPKQKQWLTQWGTIALVAILITYMGVKYPIPGLPDDAVIELGTTHFTNISAEDITATDDLAVTDDALVGGDFTVGGTASWGCSAATITNDLTITATLRAEDAVVTDTLTVSGALTVTGASNFVGDISSTDGAITVTDDLIATGATSLTGAATLASHLSVSGNLTVTGPIDLPNDISSSIGAITVTDDVAVTGAASFASTVSVDGALNWVTGIVSKATDYQLLVSESGSLVTQPGATGAGQAFTLPVAATGLNYCFYVFASTVLTITPTTGDQIHHLINSAEDRINNAVSAGDSICLTAIDTVYWIPEQEVGTWSDTD